jgi:ribosomal protein S27AE
MTATTTAENGRALKPHDHVTEWSVCGRCGTQIDWAADSIGEAIASGKRERDDTSCPNCGHGDTAWLYAD